MSTKTKAFNIADYLETDDDIQGFIDEVICIGNDADIMRAVNIAAEAKGSKSVKNTEGESVGSINTALKPLGFHLGITAQICTV